MMTVSGQLITQDAGAPTIEDIARGLSRMPRFAGQTTTPWTVAHHSLVVNEMARGDDQDLPLYALLHDAHECLTSDIPTTFKTPDMKSLQGRLDRRIYAALGLLPPEPDERAAIARLDTRALLAEAYMVTPAMTYERIVEEREQLAEFGDVVLVQYVLHHYPSPEEARDEYIAQLLFHASKERAAA